MTYLLFRARPIHLEQILTDFETFNLNNTNSVEYITYQYRFFFFDMNNIPILITIFINLLIFTGTDFKLISILLMFVPDMACDSGAHELSRHFKLQFGLAYMKF